MRGLDDFIEFTGNCETVPEFLGTLDLFVLSTTRDEGFGIVLIEALAAAVPIVASDVPACREVLADGTLGTLVPAADPDRPCRRDSRSHPAVAERSKGAGAIAGRRYGALRPKRCGRWLLGFRPDTAGVMRPPILLAAIGDANSAATFSGTPYHCLQAGREAGLFAGGLALDTMGRAWKMRRAMWNASRFLITGKRGGYQYSDSFLERLWRQVPIADGSVLINFFQLYPSSLAANGGLQRWFYIDQTLRQLFDYYGLSTLVPKVSGKLP